MKLFKKIKEIKAIMVADMLTIVAFFIVFFTTLAINIYVAMYLLSAILIVMSYFIAKRR